MTITSTFSLAHITDTHVVVDEERLTSGEVLAQDLRQIVQDAAPDLIIASGDLTNSGKLSELHAYRQAIQMIPTPVFSLFGGHDGNEERHSGAAGTSYTRNYEQILGSTYYSFDWSGRHFVIYPNEDHFFSPVDRRQKEGWFWSDLTLHSEDREIVVVVHTPPPSFFLEQLGRYNVTLVLHGHWHSSKVFSYGKIIVAATSSLCFGGIDTTPRGYRLVKFREDGIDLEFCAMSTPSQRTIASASTGHIPEGIPFDGTDEKLRLRWKRQLPVGLHRATPARWGEHLLLSLQDEDYHGRSGVYAISAQTGEYRWHVTTDASIKNTVAVAPFPSSSEEGEHGRCAAVSVTGRVYLLDIVSGSILWYADLPDYPDRWIYTSPAIARQTVYAGAKSGYAAYDMETGERQWYTAIERDDTWSCYAGPRIYEDLLLLLIPRRGLLALNREDGTVLWERRVAVEYYYPSPVVAGDLLVSGGDTGSLIVLHASSGEILWHQPVLLAEYVTGLMVDGNCIYVTTSDSEAQCYDLHSGKRYWRFQAGDDLLDMTPYRRGIRSLLSAPRIFRSDVIVPGCDGWLYVLNAASGECKNRLQFGSPITAAPCVIEDGFCVGTYNGRIYCLTE